MNGRACGCCRGAMRSNASSRCWSMRRASATAAPPAPPSASCSRTRSSGRVASFAPFFPEGAGGARAFHHRAPWRRPRPSASAPNSKRRSRAWCRPGPTRCLRRSPPPMIRSRRARCSRNMAMRSQRPIATPSPPQTRSATSRRSRHCRRSTRSASISRARKARPENCIRLKLWSLRPADPAVRARSRARAHGLHGHRRKHLPRAGRRPPASPISGSTTSSSTAAAVPRPASRRRSRGSTPALPR